MRNASPHRVPSEFYEVMDGMGTPVEDMKKVCVCFFPGIIEPPADAPWNELMISNQ